MTKKQLLTYSAIMLLSSALISAITVASGIWYLKQSQTRQADADASPASGFDLAALFHEEPQYQGPQFHPLEKIVLSVKGNNQTHFVMLELAIETRDLEQISAINDYMPKIQNALLKLFATKHYNDLQQAGAVALLQDEVKHTLLTAFEDTYFVRHIDDVLLTKYVVQ